jgi:NADPH-dependent curcumin reductase CurA
MRWVREGQLRYLEDMLEGIEQAPDAIAGLYRGENLGKRLIRIGDLSLAPRVGDRLGLR